MTTMEKRGRGRPAGQTKIETLEIRSKCVDLAKRGWTQRAIANEVDLSESAVQAHLAIYRSGLVPSSELAEEWRATKLARASERYAALGPKAIGERDPVTGEWIVEPDYQALTALQREEEAVAKLLGANLEPSMGFAVVTREQLAALLYEEPVVDVEAKEITEESA